MNLLVTGGAGFIGSHFVKSQLNSQNWKKIFVIDSLTYAGNLSNLAQVLSDDRITFIKADINDVNVIDEVTEKINTLVHFAAESHVDRSIKGSRRFVVTNVLGTQNLLEHSKKNKVEKFVHISTDEVYGSIEIGSWDEFEPLKPNSPYSASKASSDLLAISYAKTFGIDIRITRCSNNYGSFQHIEKVIPLFITNLMQDKKIPLYGNGMNSRDWLHVSDHCRAIELVIQNGIAGSIYNIGGGEELTNIELTEIILELMQKDTSYIDYVEDRKGHDLRYSVDFSKLTRETGYQPQVQFAEGLNRTISWYKNNEKWWREILNRIEY